MKSAMISLIVWVLLLHLVQSEDMKGFLLYDDLQENICNSPSCANFLTMKEKSNKTFSKMEDFTVCFRINLLYYHETGDLE